jgi:2-methylcitrate dehydratase PrpD
MHPGVVVIPAALAVGESYNRNGKAFLVAVALGLEAMIRTGEAFQGVSYKQGFHPTGTCGVFGAAVAAARIIGLGVKEMVNAIGIAGSQAAGLREARAQGTWGKRLQAGHPSMCGILSALLAERGYTGPATIFEGHDGFLRAYSYKDTYDKTRVIAGIGNNWQLLSTSIKVHACCRWTGPIVDGALEIVRQHPLKANDIEAVMVSSSTMAIKALTEPKERKIRPRTIVDAQFSLPYGAAVAIVRKKAFIDEFTENSIKDQEILNLIPKIKWRADPADDKNYPQSYSASVMIKMKNGKEYQSRVEFPKGDPENPVTQEELEDKFQDLAGRTISRDKVAKIISQVWNLEKLQSTLDLTNLLC